MHRIYNINWCFLHVKTRPFYFGFRCPVKTLLWKLIIFIYSYFFHSFFFWFFIHLLDTGNKSWVCSQIWLAKKRYQQIIKTAQLYLFILFILVQIKVIIKSDTFYKTHNTQLLSFKFKCPEINTLLQRHACLIQHYLWKRAVRIAGKPRNNYRSCSYHV